MNTVTRTFVFGLTLAVATCGSALAGQRQTFAKGGILNGTFEVTQITDPLAGIDDTDAFDAIRGRNIRFVIVFDGIDHEDNAPLADGGTQRILTTSPARVQFFGDPTGYLQNVIAPTLNGALLITIREDAAGTVFLRGFDIVEAQAPQYFGFIGVGIAEPSPGDGLPSLQEVGLDTDQMVLQRYGMLRMTDSATGSLHWSLFENVAVGVEPRTFGEMKAMYRTLE